jgi:hypothetical protein
MLDHILMNSTTIDVASQPPSALALNQLSEEDRRLVAKLKHTYPLHILESVFGDAIQESGMLSQEIQSAELIRYRTNESARVPLAPRVDRLVYSVSGHHKH